MTIITKLRVFDDTRNWEDDGYSELLMAEQINKLSVLGIDYYNSHCICHFFNGNWFDDRTEEMTIDDAVECLAIKDGVDLVQFENGNYGFVAYYNGFENGFEIIG